MTGFDESSRFLEEDKSDNLWVAHPYKGIYKITPDKNFVTATVKKYGKISGLNSDLQNHVFKIRDDLIFCSEKGVFSFDEATDRFYPNESFNNLLGGQTGVRRLFESEDQNNIWYVTEEEVGLLQIKDKVLFKEIERYPLPKYIRDQLVTRFELIYPVDEHNVFIGTETGFIHFNPEVKFSKSSNFEVIFDEISMTSKGDSVISRGLFFDGQQVTYQQPEKVIPKLPNYFNAFRFEFSATDFTEPEAMKFQFFLEGLENDWSDWTSKSEKEYTNLSNGKYTFHVRALNALDQPSKAIHFQFEILPAWYYSRTAKFVYTIIGLVLLFFFSRFLLRKYYYQKEMVVQSEKEIDRLKNERLEVEIAHKNRELASSTIHLQHKNEILFKIRNDLEKIKKVSQESESIKSINKVIKMIGIEDNSEKHWEQFIAHFSEIHPDFFENLQKQFPDLSNKDLKLCAYLRMNLSTKEIAS